MTEPERPIEVYPSQMARAMASRVTRERERIATYLEGVAYADDLRPIAAEIRDGTYGTRPAATLDIQKDMLEAHQELEHQELGITSMSSLPPHRDHDDFEEGVALVRGNHHMAGVTGRLRKDS